MMKIGQNLLKKNNQSLCLARAIVNSQAMSIHCLNRQVKIDNGQINLKNQQVINSINTIRMFSKNAQKNADKKKQNQQKETQLDQEEETTEQKDNEEVKEEINKKDEVSEDEGAEN